jgi:hypothetical protein
VADIPVEKKTVPEAVEAKAVAVGTVPSKAIARSASTKEEVALAGMTDAYRNILFVDGLIFAFVEARRCIVVAVDRMVLAMSNKKLLKLRKIPPPQFPTSMMSM